MLYRQIDDLIILSGDPIRIPKIILVIIKLFYNGTTIMFSLIIKTALRTLPVFKSHELIVTSNIPRGCKTINQGHKKGTNNLLQVQGQKIKYCLGLSIQSFINNLVTKVIVLNAE